MVEISLSRVSHKSVRYHHSIDARTTVVRTSMSSNVGTNYPHRVELLYRMTNNYPYSRVIT